MMQIICVSNPELSKSEGTFRSVPTREDEGPTRSDTRNQTERIRNGPETVRVVACLCWVKRIQNGSDLKRIQNGSERVGPKTDPKRIGPETERIQNGSKKRA